MQNVKGKFGHGEYSLSLVSIGVNEKSGMDTDEFANYIRNAIMPLYPDAAPEYGKWVVLKCDSGPGRLNLYLLADLQTSGFILFPGVPNTMAVMQEMDQNYGPFKSQYGRNLDTVVDGRIAQGKMTTIPPWQVGIAVFGGIDQETGVLLSRHSSKDSQEICAGVHGERLVRCR